MQDMKWENEEEEGSEAKGIHLFFPFSPAGVLESCK